MSTREYLSVVADIATIIGVSIAWFVGQPFVASLFGGHRSFFDFSNAVLFYFIVLILFSSITVLLWKGISKFFREKNYWRAIMQLGFWIGLVVTFAGGFMPARDVWASLLSNRYFFPAPPNEIGRVYANFDRNNGVVSGIIYFKGDKNLFYDYKVISYLKYNHDTTYKIHPFLVGSRGAFWSEEFWSEESSQINSDGTFSIPGIENTSATVGNTLDGIVVAVVTRLDAGIVKAYPGSISGVNSPDLASIGADSVAITP